MDIRGASPSTHPSRCYGAWLQPGLSLAGVAEGGSLVSVVDAGPGHQPPAAQLPAECRGSAPGPARAQSAQHEARGDSARPPQ